MCDSISLSKHSITVNGRATGRQAFRHVINFFGTGTMVVICASLVVKLGKTYSGYLLFKNLKERVTVRLRGTACVVYKSLDTSSHWAGIIVVEISL